MAPTLQHLEQCQSLWQTLGQLTFVRKVENWIYQCDASGVYLRLTEPSHRDEGQINAELDWMNHLKRCGVHFAQPLAARDGRFLHTITFNGQTFFVCVFAEAMGKQLTKAAQFTPQSIENLGRLTGQMHCATQSYQPADNAAKRPQWHEEINYQRIAQTIEQDNPLSARFDDLAQWLMTLPKDNQCYGLIHADIHPGNFRVDSQHNISLFDFDDSHYQWFAYDLAVTIDHMQQLFAKTQRGDQWTGLKQDFLRGYKQTGPLDKVWFSRIERFIEYRHFVVYCWCLETINSGQVEPRAKSAIEQAMQRNRDYLASIK